MTELFKPETQVHKLDTCRFNPENLTRHNREDIKIQLTVDKTKGTVPLWDEVRSLAPCKNTAIMQCWFTGYFQLNPKNIQDAPFACCGPKLKKIVPVYFTEAAHSGFAL